MQISAIIAANQVANSPLALALAKVEKRHETVNDHCKTLYFDPRVIFVRKISCKCNIHKKFLTQNFQLANHPYVTLTGIYL